MFGRDRIYGLDIETDNTAGHGLNPRLAGVTEIAIAAARGAVDLSVVFDDADGETNLLLAAHRHLWELPPGLIVTWNGATFDLPFLHDRIVRTGGDLGGFEPVGPLLFADEQIVPKYEPLPGHAGGYTALWPCRGGYHQHLDVAYAYKATATDRGVSWSLKPVCGALGVPMVELDRTRLHDYTTEEREAYVLSDARGTRALGIRLLGA